MVRAFVESCAITVLELIITIAVAAKAAIVFFSNIVYIFDVKERAQQV
jgi:hypothetical protein